MKDILWAFVVGGGWIAISPWLLGFPSESFGMWSNVLVGGLIVIGALSLIARKEP